MSHLADTFRQRVFHGGVHPAEGKALTAGAAIQPAPLLARYTVMLQQNIGAPPKPMVKVGDPVMRGQRLAEPGGFVSVPVHAPTSGKVAAIEDVPGPFGVPAPAIVIEADGQDTFGSDLAPMPDGPGADPAALRDRIRYRYSETPMGGRVDIIATDPAAIAAIHRFLRFQIEDHKTGDDPTPRARPSGR